MCVCVYVFNTVNCLKITCNLQDDIQVPGYQDKNECSGRGVLLFFKAKKYHREIQIYQLIY